MKNSLSEDKLETTIANLTLYCFRNGILHEKLLIAIYQALTLAQNQNIGIDRFQEYYLNLNKDYCD
jgi:hypothetical protein